MLKLPSISVNLRQAKNSLSPINSLPPEILPLIQTFRASEKDLIRATAVCKYWRNTLVSTPSLWNNVAYLDRAVRESISPRVRTYLERSGSVPVKLQIHARASRLLSPYTERISGLTVFIDNHSDLDEIAKHLSKPAPLIETVTLCGLYRPPRGLVLPSEFFEAFLSSARTLVLNGATLSPGSYQLPKLTKFTLDASSANVTFAVLLDTLEQMPLLRVFEAILCRPQGGDAIPENRVVTLSRLEKIAITVDENRRTPVASPILPALNLPSARSVFLGLIDAAGAPLTPILPPPFKERLPRLSVLPKAAITFGTYGSIVFHGFGDSRLEVRINANALYAFTEPVFGGLPFDSVRKLLVSFRSSAVDAAFFVQLLRFMGGLEYLQLKRNSTGSLARWAREHDQAGICPALSRLVIIDADYKAKEYVELIKRARKRAGVPIAKVEIRYS